MNQTLLFKRFKNVLFTLLVLAAVSGSGAFAQDNEVKLGVNEKGVEIDAGVMGKFLLPPPFLSMATGADKGVEGVWKADDGEGEASYPNGTKLIVKLKKDEVICTFKDLPKDGEPKFMFIMSIPLSFNQGGKFRFEEADKKLSNFPVDIETEQFITTGIRSEFDFTDKDGNGLAIDVRSNWYGLQDNRVFRSNEFSYQFLIDLKAVAGNNFAIKIKRFKP